MWSATLLAFLRLLHIFFLSSSSSFSSSSAAGREVFPRAVPHGAVTHSVSPLSHHHPTPSLPTTSLPAHHTPLAHRAAEPTLSPPFSLRLMAACYDDVTENFTVAS
ncbi:hypothetical protein E2C01_027566 [Portunus trituberculatus]|uniref:Secreted protein n=1 Tax=Portunus trituberculatus TaxID=210409 RepID=A0A5B7ELW2_PORTR|nr:hypothetical protein [Portunus trituberculatus]